MLNSLRSASGQRTYDHAIREFVAWYCSEPRLAFNRMVVLRHRSPGTAPLRASNDHPPTRRGSTFNSATDGARSRNEAMREIGIDGQGLAYTDLLHHDEAQAVHKAVRLVVVSLEVVESKSLFVRAGPMYTCELLPVELLTQSGRLCVTDFPRQRDRFSNDVIGCQEMLGQPQILEGAKDFDDARVVDVSLRDECEEESGIEKDHTFRWP